MNTLRIIAVLFCFGIATHAGEAKRVVPEIIWGITSNQCRVGIRIQPVLSKGEEVPKQTVLYFGTTNRTGEIEVFSPTVQQVFLATLKDSDSKFVPKTAYGRKYGQPAPESAMFQDKPRGGPNRWQPLIASASKDGYIGHFNILDHFDLTKPGNYELSVEVRLYQRVGNGHLKLVKLPPCSVIFHLK